MTIRQNFDQLLKELHLDVVKMASLTEESIKQTIEALNTKDKDMAFNIIENDHAINKMEDKIANKCIELIATQQPTARDLRNITAVLKMITDIERIADHSVDISELMLETLDERYVKPPFYITSMASVACKMVKDVIDAYINRDGKLAEKVCEKDAIVDEYFDKVINDLQNLMYEQKETIKQSTVLMFIAKYFEKIADHATNIGEWVIYQITGDHENLN